MRELIIDNFAGGGGASCGIESALGVPVDIAIDHDRAAIEMHMANHPNTKHLCEDIRTVNPPEVTEGRPVGLAWFSPDCTHFSRAKGGRPVDKKIRGLAWVVIRWARLVKPRVIVLENVSEFQEWGPLTEDNRPCKKRKGKTFTFWVNQLRGLGYDVEWKELIAADYGAPTIRKRLFLIARCDGQPIVWPKATHGPGLKPYRAAAECIDFSLPCPSIFLTEEQVKKLKPNIRRPLKENTMRRIAKGLRRYVIEAKEPFVIAVDQSGSNGDCSPPASQPLRTITKENRFTAVVPYMSEYHGPKSETKVRGGRCDDPIETIDTQNRFALVSAFLSKYYTCSNPCGSLKNPAPTVTAIDHNALVATHLTEFYGTNIGSDMKNPVPTVTGSDQHIGQVRAFLVKYYGTNVGHSLKDPCHTVTAKHRLGLITVAGYEYRIADIGLRMLQPRELARAQGFPDSYVLTGTKTSQVAKIGNSVCPPIAMAVVKANVELHDIKLKAAI
jgi:DNA (cytosine-5)-methyltransferase 1